jgi:hypothetical protein
VRLSSRKRLASSQHQILLAQMSSSSTRNPGNTFVLQYLPTLVAYERHGPRWDPFAPIYLLLHSNAPRLQAHVEQACRPRPRCFSVTNHWPTDSALSVHTQSPNPTPLGVYAYIDYCRVACDEDPFDACGRLRHDLRLTGSTSARIVMLGCCGNSVFHLGLCRKRGAEEDNINIHTLASFPYMLRSIEPLHTPVLLTFSDQEEAVFEGRSHPTYQHRGR